MLFKTCGGTQVGGGGRTQVFVVVFRTCGGAQVGVIGVVTTSCPSGANGFGLPSVLSRVREMLESCKLIKAGSEKMLSSIFICWTLSRSDKKSCVTKTEAGVFAAAVVPSMFGRVVLLVVETKLGCAGDGFIKKI